MKRTSAAHKLHIQLDTKNCDLRPGEIRAMEGCLEPLAAAVESFPVSDLAITVAYFSHAQEFHVRTSLILSGATLFTGEHDSDPLPAFERCVRKLVKKIEARKSRTARRNGATPKFAEGMRQSLDPAVVPELYRAEAAVLDGDYPAFRTVMAGFDESIRRRVGRWAQRYPELDRLIDDAVLTDEIVEEVLLNAFERFPKRPRVMRLGDWLEGLIDPSIRSLLRHPEEELEAVSFVRTLREMSGDPEAAPDEETLPPASGRFAVVPEPHQKPR